MGSLSGSGNVVGGLTPFQTAAFNQATGENQQAMANRYSQLGIGGPGSVNPEGMDISGLGLLSQAAAAPLEQGNVANQLAAQNLGNQESALLASDLGTLAYRLGFGSLGGLFG